MKFLVKEIRSKEGVLHFKRWRLFSCPWFNIYIHRIYKSDEDKDPHNHPWKFTSLVLGGSYQETDKDGNLTTVRKIGSIHTLELEEYHKLTVLKPATTLVLTGGRKPELWGYWTESGFIDWITYRRIKGIKR